MERGLGVRKWREGLGVREWREGFGIGEWRVRLGLGGWRQGAIPVSNGEDGREWGRDNTW